MQKSDKKDYFNAKIYKSIALLNTLSEVLKFIVFEHLQNIIKACDLILNIQMKACKHRLINMTLQLIIKKIYCVKWYKKKSSLTAESEWEKCI